MIKSYLIIWQQYNDAKETRNNTPVDILVNDSDRADVIYEKLKNEIQNLTGYYYDIAIIAIYIL